MENTLFDNTDTTLSPTNNDILKLTNIIFTDNNNTVNSGLINQSHFINGYWNNGIIYNSIWNGSTFNNGVFNSGYWVNGTFSGGIFLNSKDTKKTSVPFDNVKWIRTWLGGNFNAGQFSKSTWLNGTFNNGRFSESDWYGGIWNNGILGSSTIAYNNTTMGYYLPISGGATFTIWNNGIVDNALIGGSGSVYWYGGKFNGGEFTSFGKISSNESIWYGGDFNGGKVTGLSRWKNGNFNAGKFLSYYGYQNVSPTNSSTFSTDYGWENGRFNGGEFGNASTGTNSVWYNGEFNGGVFTGRFWNYGIFTKGSFIGSGLTSLSVNSYVQSFTNSYYGFWNDGFVSDRKNLIQTEKRIFTELIRKVDEKPILNDVFISNILWMSGTFSHGLGKLYNSTWLDGTFVKGSLINTQFNPYVDRTFTGATSYSFNFNDTCVWKNGNFINGSFYISEWENGIFYGGDMNGGIWRNGTWNYGKANNVYWENGLWRNGIWNGSLFTQSSIDSSYNVTPGYEHDIMINVAQASGTNSLHLINAISATYSTEYLSDPDFNNGLDANLTSTTKSLYSDDDWYNNSAYNDWLYIQSVFSINNYNVPQINLSSYDPNVYSRPNATADLYLTVDASKFGGSGPTLSVLQRLSGTAYDPTGIWQSSPDNTIFYDVSIDVCAEWGGSSAFWNQSTINYFSYLSDKEIIRVYYGSTYIDTTISTLVTSQSYQNPPRTNWYNYSRKTTINFSIQESQIILSSNKNRTIKINRLNVTGWAGPIVRILNASIKSRVSSYDPVNNTLYPAMPSAPTFSSNISIPNNLQLSVISGHYKVSLTFGNGLFKAGIWENGVWNNGWRKDECVKPFIFTSAVPMIDGHTWNITLHALGISSQIDNSMQSLSIGDKVSIGNIISIDKNNRRRLLKNYYRIISKDANTDGSFTSITCQVIVDFPIVNIEIDSLSHINYVTKNVWVSGIFLNGYFTGVWNDGLVKGRPYLTFLENTQWIDGQFNGGHFKGLTDSITNLLGDIISYVGTKKLGKQDIGSYIDSKYNTQNLIYYNNSLIQNFNFNDVYDVTSGTGSDARYDSWIDVNYSTQSQSNLNKESISYNSITFNGTQSEYIKNDYNLYGYPTYDILSSYSTLTDYDSINQKTYNLGSKYTTNYNFIPDNGNFNKPISTQISFVGTSNFDNNGWSFTNYSSGAGFSPVEYSSNIDSTTSGKLKFLGTTVNGTYSYGRLDNTNIKELVEKNRYYLMSLDIATTSGTSIMFKPSTTTTPGYFDHKNTTSNKKIEYFYNKQDLELTLFNWLGHYGSNNNLDIRFNNISFYEVDMIPFFQFTDPSNINSFVSAPYYVSYVPEIDYSNSNYNFINSVNIVIPLSEVVSQSLNYPNLNSLLLAEVPIIKSG